MTLNYLYCDVLGLTDHEQLKQYLTGTVNGLDMSRGFLLGAGILMEIPIAMVLLARVLRYQANRWANVAAGAVMTRRSGGDAVRRLGDGLLHLLQRRRDRRHGVHRLVRLDVDRLPCRY